MQRTSHTPVFVFSGFRLDPNRRLLLHDNQPVSLHPKALDLLVTLVENRDRVLSKSELLDTLWEGQFVEENNLAVQVSALRRILGETSNEHRFIVTVPGRGYRFVSEVGLDFHEVREDTPTQVDSKHNGYSDDGPDKSEAPEEKLIAPSQPPPYYLYVFTIFILLVGGAWLYWSRDGAVGPGGLKLTRLTTSGRAINAALSPDEQFLVFAQKEADGESLWLRQIETGSQTRIIQSKPFEYVGLSISPDNHFIYFSTFGANQAATLVQRIPLLGGTTENVGNIDTGVAVSFSPDGHRFAFTQSSSSARQSSLNVADSDGGNVQTLLRFGENERIIPSHKVSPVAWSPDGSQIALAMSELDDAGRRMSEILLVDPTTGSTRSLVKPVFDSIHSLAWTDAHHLGFVALEPTASESQVWTVNLSSGEIRRITNDLQSYVWLSAGRRGKLVTVQKSETSSVRIADFEDGLTRLESRELLHEPDVLVVAFGPDDSVYYTSRRSGAREIWRLEHGATDPQQVTVGASVAKGFSISPRDGSLVFSSRREGLNSLWITDANGKNLRRLTDGSDHYPQFMPDGASVVFQRGTHNFVTLWRVGISDETPPVRITSEYSAFPTLSPDGQRIAFYFMDNKTDGQWRIGVVSTANGEFLSKLSFPRSVSERRMRWHPSGRFLGQIFNTGETANLMLIPIDGGEPGLISDLGNGIVNSFGWSADGRKIVYLLTTEGNDAVSLTNF